LSDDWKGFRRAWTNLSLVRFVNVNILSEGVFLWEVDPTPYTQAVFRFVWEVKGTEYDAFVSQTLLGEVLGDVEKARNREAGGFEIIVDTEEQKAEVLEKVKKLLKEESWGLIRVLVA